MTFMRILGMVVLIILVFVAIGLFVMGGKKAIEKDKEDEKEE
jgi:uncharacterized protein YneF (UPF0154 family)